MASLLVSGLVSAQETEVSVSLQPGYTNQVFYKFSTNIQTPVAATSWDIAFENVVGTQGLGAVRINDGKGITLFQVANTPSGYDTVDVALQDTWTQLYNSDTTWSEGAFDQGTATYGWGEYNMGSHHVEGTIVYVLKYSATSFKKLIIQDYFGGFTFKYASWNGTAWTADTITTTTNTPNSGTQFNYYSLDTNNLVTVAPANNAWDMVFTKYTTETMGTMYPVTGVLHNSKAVTVAKTDEAGDSENPALPAESAYSTDINTIGWEWKTLNNQTFTYEIDPNQTFYVKNLTDSSVYRLHFTSFAGSSTGNLTFNTKNVVPALGLDEVNESVSFTVYPNPSTDGKVTLIYDLKNSGSDKNTVSIYSLTGAKVFETSITNNAGFYTKDLNLSGLSAGIYMLNVQAGNQVKTQKLIIK